MGHKEIKIDVAAMAIQALRERRPSEQLDDTLLRIAKDRYGESGTVVFQAIKAARNAMAKRSNVSQDEALQQIMDGQRSISLITYPHAVGANEAID